MKHNIVNKLLLLCCCLMVLSLSSCGIYGKYKSQEDPQLDSINIPSYKDIFTDEYLIALIDTAIVNNYDLAIAHENVEQAKAALLGAKLAYIPSIAATPSATWGKTSGNASPGWGIYDFGQASWEIDIFGRLTNKKRIANASKKEMEAYKQAVAVELVASVAETYYNILMLDAQIITVDSSSVNWQKSVETMKAMKEAGMTDEAAVAQFEGSYYATLAKAKDLKIALDKAENAMKLLLCKGDQGAIVRGDLETTVQKAGKIKEVNLQVARVRPDVKAAEFQLEQAFYSLNLARANCCPSITLSGTLGFNGGLIFSAVGSLVQPIFNSGKNIAEVRGAKHGLKAAEYNYGKALLTAAVEVNEALLSQELYIEQKPDIDNRVSSMERALDATQTKMNLGKGTYLEVLTAQNDLLTSQLSQITNAMNILKSGVDLYQAIGGGK